MLINVSLDKITTVIHIQLFRVTIVTFVFHHTI